MKGTRETVAWACRILAYHGHGDLTLGHVSVREGDKILMKRKGLGLEEVTSDDVLTLDLDGRRLRGEGRVHLEAALHTEVYKARADVGAVIHTHPPFTTALAASEAPLGFLSHDALMFPDGVAIFDETADLIVSAETGRQLARALGSRRAVLLRNHGVLVVGPDVPWAVLAAVTLERAVRLQIATGMLGRPLAMADAALPPLHASKYRDEFVEEYWAYWIRCLRRSGLDAGMRAHRAARRSRK